MATETEVTNEKNGTTKKVAAKKDYIHKKVDFETAKAISSLRDKANKKTFGRDIKDSEIIAAAIGLLGPEQIKALQDTTYSEQDRLYMAHEEHIRQHGKISLDQFIGKLMRGEIRST